MAATQTSPQQQQETRQTFEAAQPGDRVEVEHRRHGRPAELDHEDRRARWSAPSGGGTACTSAGTSTTRSAAT